MELILRPDAGGKTIYRASLDVLARRTEHNPEPKPQLSLSLSHA